jgi:hypothetical protein
VTKPTTPAAPPNPALVAQAKSVQSLMAQSVAAHAGINGAIAAISNCTNIPAAVQTLTNAADVRTQLARQVESMNLTALTNNRIAANFSHAMTASAAADVAYAAWGRQVAPHCVAPARHTANYTAATQDDGYATGAKQTFVTLWNPVAKKAGLPAAAPDSL